MEKLKKITLNTILLIFSLLFGFVLLEGLSHLIFDPIDYIAPDITSDPILSHKILPSTGGHDEWGFRNKTVPDQCDIVTLGCSHTYGINATYTGSWPYQLSSITGKEIYNLGIGGYCPTQSFYLLNEKAFKLKPKIIICDFYLGTNLNLTHNNIYGLKYWEKFRDSSYNRENQEKNIKNIIVRDNPKGLLNKFKFYLINKSLLFRIIVKKTPLEVFFYSRQLKIDKKQGYSTFTIPNTDITTGFDTPDRLNIQNLNLIQNKEGLRLSLLLFKEMSIECKKRNIDLRILIIPTKQSVYSDYIFNKNNKSSILIDSLIENERLVVNQTINFFNKNKIKYIEVLNQLQQELNRLPLYSSNYDGHTNENGYSVIAKTVANVIFLEQN